MSHKVVCANCSTVGEMSESWRRFRAKASIDEPPEEC